MIRQRAFFCLLAVLLVLAPAAYMPAHAQLFGESDEEKAARKAHEDGQDAAIGQLSQRVHDLEDSLARATGANELLGHRLDELNQKIVRQQKDFEYRLCTLAAQQLGATPGQAGAQGGGLNCGGQIGEAAPAPQASYPGSVVLAAPGTPSAPPEQAGAPGPRVLGTLSARQAAAGPPPPAGQMQRSAVHGQFDAAMNLLAKAQYDEARAAFRAYADNNPQDNLAPQAVYWAGDIYYVQQDYPSAARAFAEGIKKYPKSSRAADSMLKLGQSLLAMGQKAEGCTTLNALKKNYSDASPSTLNAALNARKAASCPVK